MGTGETWSLSFLKLETVTVMMMMMMALGIKNKTVPIVFTI